MDGWMDGWISDRSIHAYGQIPLDFIYTNSITFDPKVYFLNFNLHWLFFIQIQVSTLEFAFFIWLSATRMAWFKTKHLIDLTFTWWDMYICNLKSSLHHVRVLFRANNLVSTHCVWNLVTRVQTQMWSKKPHHSGSEDVELFHIFVFIQSKMSHVTRKPVFGVCHQVRLKPACSATETS